MSETLRVNEFFGPTFQGEGPFAGQLVHFLRLNRCNLHCSWCDTPYTWADTEAKAALHQSGIMYPREDNETEWSIESAVAVVLSNSVQFLVISGGEPLLQARALEEFIGQSPDNMKIQFETAGTLPPIANYGPDDEVYYVVSPKLDNSGNDARARFKLGVLRQFVEREANFKFVARTLEDLDEVELIVDEAGIPAECVWVMPEGSDPMAMLEHAKLLADPTRLRGWNMTLRMHTLLWGDERGR